MGTVLEMVGWLIGRQLNTLHKVVGQFDGPPLCIAYQILARHPVKTSIDSAGTLITNEFTKRIFTQILLDKIIKICKIVNIKLLRR